MTTIAYKAGVLAADSLTTVNGMRDSFAQKIWQVGPLLIGGAGSSALCIQFYEWVKEGMEGQCPIRCDGANGFIVTPDDTIVTWGENGPWTSRGVEFCAFGSGERFALGAMAAGASAEEAVAAAIRFDVYSGGPIRTLAR